MNPHARRSASPFTLLKSLIVNRELVQSMVKREINGRYRGSIMGLMWSFVNPILMLAVYTFVFSVVFKARWQGGSESKTEFALIVFSGLMIFNLFAESINRSPTLIVGNVSYVKKVVFPLELLTLIAFSSAFFHFLISLMVWIVFFCIFFGFPPVTIFWLPIILIPLALSTLGLSWFLASLGVYIRDVAQFVSIFLTVLMFLSPIFYPMSTLPQEYHLFMKINPLTFVVEQARAVMIFGDSMNLREWFIQMMLSLLIAFLGFYWFQKTRKGFADVI
jgi:lipopolysaccharide transport system permease protein